MPEIVSPYAARPARPSLLPTVIRWGVGLALAGLTVAAVAGGLLWVQSHPSAPYNVRQLTRDSHKALRALAVGLATAWLVFVPAWVSRYLSTRRGGWGLLLLPGWAWIIGQMGFHLLFFAVTLESIHDIVGSPVLEAMSNWELIFRFVCLYGTLGVWILTAGYVAGSWENPQVGRPWQRSFWACALGALCLTFCWPVVLVYNVTDNIQELVAGGPGGPFWLSVTAGLAVVPAVWMATALGRKRFGCFLAGLVAAGLGVWLSWHTAQMGFQDPVRKYGMEFPALQFLLGPDRSDLLGQGELALRWMLLQGSLMGLVLVGQLGGRAVAGAGKGPGPRGREFPRLFRKTYLAACGIWLIVLMYGSGFRFSWSGRSLEEGLAFYRRAMLEPPERWGNIDMVVNVTIQVVMGFFAAGLLWPRRLDLRRSGALLSGLLVLCFSALLGLGLEFMQVWIAGRMVSLHDVLCQVLGAGWGLMIWTSAGPEADRWLKDVSLDRQRSLWFLWGLYLVSLFAYELYPYLPRPSMAFVGQKWAAGAVAFGYTGATWGNVTALASLQILLYAPLGYLAARLLRIPRAFHAVLLSAGGSAVLEIVKLVLPRRSTTLVDVALAALAGWIGFRLAGRSSRTGHVRAKS